MKFEEFGLDDSIIEAIGYMGFEEATPIQENAIPKILENRDLIACAQTGTGKTAAFILPVLHQLVQNPRRKKTTYTLILVPTRELAIQIDQQFQGMAYFTNTTCHAVYGGGTGVSFAEEQRALRDGADIIIATPGRLKAHMQTGKANLSDVQYLILDEADRMLDIGFYDDIIRIIKALPKKRQSLMFSATMAPKIRKLAREILSDPEELNFNVSKPAEGVTQEIYLAHEDQKEALTEHLIKQHPDFKSILVFCSTKKKVEQVIRRLNRKNFNVQGISSDYSQDERGKVLLEFKSRRTRILIATDVLSRGIDIKDIDLVINYDVPNDAEDYVHRVGRTARAETRGVAITMVSGSEMYKFRQIEEFIERDFEKKAPPEELGPGPNWNPGQKSSKGRGKPRNFKGGKGRNKKHSGGKKPHHGKKGKGPQGSKKRSSEGKPNKPQGRGE